MWQETNKYNILKQQLKVRKRRIFAVIFHLGFFFFLVIFPEEEEEDEEEGGYGVKLK